MNEPNTNSTPQLETISAKDLLTRPVIPLAFTIDTILPHGLFILAGSPKVGKSWLALDICRAVADGGCLWQYTAAQGDVLYLALEDNPNRLQERLSKVSPDCNLETPTDIHFVTKTQRLGDGLAEQLAAFLDAHPQTKLIIVDTLQYIRNSTSTYSGDYRDMDALREIIVGRNLTMLLITHTRKTGDSDPLNLISGSTGLVGAVDGVFVLEKDKRIGNAARLTVANRDTEGHQFELRFDSINCRWQFVAELGSDDDDDDALPVLLNCLLDEAPSWRGTSTQLCAALSALDPEYNASPVSLSKSLKSRQAFLRTQHGIACDFTRNKAARLIKISRVPVGENGENAETAVLRAVG